MVRLELLFYPSNFILFNLLADMLDLKVSNGTREYFRAAFNRILVNESKSRVRNIRLSKLGRTRLKALASRSLNDFLELIVLRS